MGRVRSEAGAELRVVLAIGALILLSVPAEAARRLLQSQAPQAAPSTQSQTANAARSDASLERYDPAVPIADKQYDTLLNLKNVPEVSELEFKDAVQTIQELLGHVGVKSNVPWVVFVGVGNTNRTILVSCEHSGESPCREWQPPTDLDLRRARQVLVVFIEDSEAPFDTVIDVEFRTRASDSDYEEFYPAALTPRPAGSIKVRLGVKSIVLREAPKAVQVGFTRQSATYGVRQWVRVYRQYSRNLVSIGASVLIPALRPGWQRVRFEPRTTPDGSEVLGSFVTVDKLPRQVLAGVTLRFPQRLGIAADTPGAFRRLVARFSPPNIVFAVGLPQRDNEIYFAGVDVPILDRLSVFLGGARFREDTLAPGLISGSRLPAGMTDEQATPASLAKGRTKVLFGVAIDLVHTR